MKEMSINPGVTLAINLAMSSFNAMSMKVMWLWLFSKLQPTV